MSPKFYIPHLIALYNRGVLTEKSDSFYSKWGFRIIRRNGKVVEIVPDIT